MNQANQVSPRMRFFFVRIFPWPFFLVGVVTLYLGFRGVYRARESAGWPSVDGTVQNSSVEYHTSDDGGTYHAEVFYEFQVDGQTHSGNKVAFGDYGSSNPSHAQSIVSRYPQGKTVNVYYRPGNPDLCVLEPGLQGQAWFLPGFGLVFATAGTLMLVYLPKTLKKAPASEVVPGAAIAEQK